MRYAIPLLMLLLLSACSMVLISMYGIEFADPNDYVQIRDRTETTYDPAEDSTEIKGPLVFPERNISSHSYFLRALFSGRQTDDPSEIQLHVSAYLSDWAFLDRAYSQGRRLSVTEISREVGSCSAFGCSKHEDLAINLTLADLESYSDNGLEVKIEGDQGSITLAVPSPYFRAFLDEMRQAPFPNRPRSKFDFLRPSPDPPEDGPPKIFQHGPAGPNIGYQNGSEYKPGSGLGAVLRVRMTRRQNRVSIRGG